jgi:hypothetical protein
VTVGAIIQTEPILGVIRRELKRISPGVKASQEELCTLLEDVLKRDVLEGESAEKAASLVQKCSGKLLRKRRRRKSESSQSTDDAPGTDAAPDTVGDDRSPD